jgi:hypothetical protein
MERVAEVTRSGSSEPVEGEGPIADDALLPGESLCSDRLDDAVHWEAVYAELTRFLLELEGGSPGMTATLARFRRRLEYWRGRGVDLGGS